jgi:hypothetical protein
VKVRIADNGSREWVTLDHGLAQICRLMRFCVTRDDGSAYSATGISKCDSKLQAAAVGAATEESNQDFDDIVCWVEKLRNARCSRQMH